MKICSVCQRCYEDAAVSCTEGNHGSLIAARPGTREIVAGYRLDFLLERDAAGETYTATNTSLDQPFVIKFTALDNSDGAPDLRQRFQTEARAATNINHPNAARVYQSGTLEDGELFTVSESVDGKTLRGLLRNNGALSEAVAVTIARQAAEGLEAAHAVGVTHRAVSPANIILVQDEQGRATAKVRNFDFGGIGQQIIVADISDGKPQIDALRYMAPEQYAGQAVDARTDIYSLGVVLYEMLTGRSPFDAPTSEAILHKQMNEQPLERLSFDTKALLTHILRLSLQKSPTARPPTAANFARQLRHIEQLLGKSPLPVQNPHLPSAAPDAPAAQTVFDNAPELDELSVEKSRTSQIASPVDAGITAANSPILPMPDDDIEEETLIRTAPVFQPDAIKVRKKAANIDSPASEPVAAAGKEINADLFTAQPIPVKRREAAADLFVVQPIRVKKKRFVPTVPKPIVVPVPSAGNTRAKAAAPDILKSFENNHAPRRAVSTRQSWLIGVGLLALLAFAALGAYLFNRDESRQPVAQQSTTAASPTAAAEPQAEEPISAPKDYAAANSAKPETQNIAPVERTPPIVAERRKGNQPLAETPVNNTLAKQNEPIKPNSAVENPAAIERANPSQPVEASNDGAARTELNTSLNKWISATNARDVDGQMNYYAPKVDAFYRTRNASQEAVRAEKKRVFDRAGAVDIQTSKPEIQVSPDGRSAKMRFNKKYVITEGQRNRRGEVIQELQWVKSGAGWKIVSERDVKVVNR